MRPFSILAVGWAIHATLVAGCDPGGATEPASASGGTPTSSPPATKPLIEDPGPLDTSATCTPGQMPASGQLQGPYGTYRATISGQEYFLQVNEWGAVEPQTLAYGDGTFFRITQQQASSPTDQGPTGFPSMFIGANSGHSTSTSSLPKPVSALTSVPTTWIWKDAGAASDANANLFNATYDVWFSTNPNGDPAAYAPSGGYLMVWLYDPPIAQPMGTRDYTNVTIPGVTGSWEVWVGLNNGKPVVSYVRKQATYAMTFDLNAFIKDAVTNRPGTIQSIWYLTNVFIGFEIWQGGVGIETTGFCVFVI